MTREQAIENLRIAAQSVCNSLRDHRLVGGVVVSDWNLAQLDKSLRELNQVEQLAKGGAK